MTGKHVGCDHGTNAAELYNYAGPGAINIRLDR